MLFRKKEGGGGEHFCIFFWRAWPIIFCSHPPAPSESLNSDIDSGRNKTGKCYGREGCWRGGGGRTKKICAFCASRDRYARVHWPLSIFFFPERFPNLHQCSGKREEELFLQKKSDWWMDRPFSEFKNYISFLSNRGRDGKKLNTRREQSQIQKKKKIARRYYRDFPPKKPAPTKQKNIRGSQTSRHYYYYISPPFPPCAFFRVSSRLRPPGALISVRIIVLCLGKRGRDLFKKNSGRCRFSVFRHSARESWRGLQKSLRSQNQFGRKYPDFVQNEVMAGKTNACSQTNFITSWPFPPLSSLFSPQTSAPTPPPLSAPQIWYNRKYIVAWTAFLTPRWPDIILKRERKGCHVTLLIIRPSSYTHIKFPFRICEWKLF